jgi:transcription elongation factor GreA
MGDLSENGAYKAARFELSYCDRRLRYLKSLAFLGQVTVPSQLKTVAFGHRVTLKTPAGTKTFQLVNQYESDPAAGKISTESPLGQLLLGRREGETVTLKSEAGAVNYTLLKISI